MKKPEGRLERIVIALAVVAAVAIVPYGGLALIAAFRSVVAP